MDLQHGTALWNLNWQVAAATVCLDDWMKKCQGHLARLCCKVNKSVTLSDVYMAATKWSNWPEKHKYFLDVRVLLWSKNQCSVNLCSFLTICLRHVPTSLFIRWLFHIHKLLFRVPEGFFLVLISEIFSKPRDERQISDESWE